MWCEFLLWRMCNINLLTTIVSLISRYYGFLFKENSCSSWHSSYCGVTLIKVMKSLSLFEHHRGEFSPKASILCVVLQIGLSYLMNDKARVYHSLCMLVKNGIDFIIIRAFLFFWSLVYFFWKRLVLNSLEGITCIFSLLNCAFYQLYWIFYSLN